MCGHHYYSGSYAWPISKISIRGDSSAYVMRSEASLTMWQTFSLVFITLKPSRYLIGYWSNGLCRLRSYGSGACYKSTMLSCEVAKKRTLLSSSSLNHCVYTTADSICSIEETSQFQQNGPE